MQKEAGAADGSDGREAMIRRQAADKAFGEAAGRERTWGGGGGTSMELCVRSSPSVSLPGVAIKTGSGHRREVGPVG